MPTPDGFQRTLARAVQCRGVGLHSGAAVRLALYPAPVGHGLVVRRSGQAAGFPARYDHVVDTRLCTVLADPADPAITIGTVEHLTAALAGFGIDNAVIETDGPELPIMDGSAAPFAALIDEAGLADQPARVAAIEVLRPIRVTARGGAEATLGPPPPEARHTLTIDATIVFDDTPVIGTQHLRLVLSAASFQSVAGARTFTRLAEVAAAQAAGLARGGSLDNAIVVDKDRVLNQDGLRMPDEFVRHKVLDCIGDLALAGAPLHACYTSRCGGHALNNLALRALFAEADAWRWV